MPVIVEAVLRAAVAFAALLFLTRITGRKQYSQLTFFDFVTGTAIGSMGALIAANVNLNVWAATSALIVFVALLILNSYLTLESRPLRKLVMGEPVIVVHNGRILEGNMAQMRYSVDDLTTQMREKGYFDVGNVEYAILETDGQLSVLPKSRNSGEVAYASLGTDGKLYVDKKQDALNNVTDPGDKEV